MAEQARQSEERSAADRERHADSPRGVVAQMGTWAVDEIIRDAYAGAC